MHVPGTEGDLAAQGLAYVNHQLAPDRPRDGSQPPTVVGDLLSCAIDREVLDPFALYEQ